MLVLMKWSTGVYIYIYILLWTPSYGPLHMDGQLEPIYNSSVPVQDVASKSSRVRWTMETGGERGSRRSVLAV